MAETNTSRKTGTKHSGRPSGDDLSQVVLFNDDYNDAAYVVLCLMRIFSHPTPLAEKIMIEAHTRGKAIAEVESTEQAKAHCAQMQSAGLGATVESI